MKLSGILVGLLVSGTSLACPLKPADSSRIAVAGGSIAEIIYLLGQEGKIIAADRTSNYPAAALQLPSIGYVRGLSTEGVLSLEPTLVLGEDDMGPPIVIEQLQKAGVDVSIVPERTDADGILEKIKCVAKLIDAPDEALKNALGEIQADYDFLSSNSMNDNSKVAVLLSLQDGVPTAGGLGTSADGVMKMAGLNNVFSDFEGWKPVASESMIEQNPEFIFMPARSVKSNGGIEQILKNPIISLTDAGRNGNVFEVDGMALLGFGPRTISVARQLSEQVAGSDRE